MNSGESPSGGAYRKAILEVVDPAGLDAVGPYIHDCWFDLADLERTSGGSVLSIPYARRGSRTEPGRAGWRPRRSKAPLYRWWLRFDAVRDVHLVDTEEIGRYDFNKLAYEPATIGSACSRTSRSNSTSRSLSNAATGS